MILLPIGRAIFQEYIKHFKNVTYIFQVGNSDYVFSLFKPPQNVTYNFEVYPYKFGFKNLFIRPKKCNVTFLRLLYDFG